MKKTILFLFVSTLFITSLQANNIRAGAISLKQLSSLNVEATVNLVIASHADVTDLELCWGDGACTSLQQLSESVNAAQGMKYYTFKDVHTYTTLGPYIATINHCCYDGDISNIENGAASDFQIETMIVLTEDLNTTPTFSNSKGLVDVDNTVATLTIVGADEDPEGDTYSNQECEIENVINYTGINFPNSVVFLSPTDEGIFVWTNPGFGGVYIVQVCTEETRNGAVISSSKRIVCFGVDDGFIEDTKELSDSEILLYPNPVSRGRLYLERRGELNVRDAKIQIVNGLGVEVERSIWSGIDESVLEIGHLSNGNYTVILELKDGTRFYKQIVILR